MNCPLCSKPFSKAKFESVTAEICSNCKGIWFASGSDFAAAATAYSNKEKSLSPRRKPLAEQLKPLNSNYSYNLNCPSCHKKLQKFNYAVDSGIYLSKCPACNGLWTDDSSAIKHAAEYLIDDPKMMKMARELASIEREKQAIHEVVDEAPQALIEGLLPPVPSFREQQYIPYATSIVTILATIIFLIESYVVNDLDTFMNSFGTVPARFPNIGTISAIMLHASWLHLIGNMFFLWIFAPRLEDYLGMAKFFILLLLCGVGGNVLDTISRWNSIEPAIGASGAIAGLIGICLLLFPRGRITIVWGVEKTKQVPAWAFCISWIFWQLFSGVPLVLTGSTDVGYSAHIGGFITGLLAAYAIKRLAATAAESDT